MFVVIHETSPGVTELVERHPEVKTLEEGRKVLSKWMEKGDRTEIVADFISDNGKYHVRSIAIFPEDGEPTDIFGQLYLPNRKEAQPMPSFQSTAAEIRLEPRKKGGFVAYRNGRKLGDIVPIGDRFAHSLSGLRSFPTPQWAATNLAACASL